VRLFARIIFPQLFYPIGIINFQLRIFHRAEVFRPAFGNRPLEKWWPRLGRLFLIRSYACAAPEML
jgi:hypothetical protein